VNGSPFNRRVAFAALATLALGAMLAGATLRAAAATTEVTDDTGRRVKVPEPPLRIASLAPNVTAMLFAAGAGSQVVATTEYSVEPAAAQRVARIGDANAIDLERLIALRPSVIVSWPDGENPAEIARIERLGLPIYRERVARLADFPGSLRRLGALAGTGAAADRAADAIEARLAALARRYADARPVTVLLQVWSRPVYTIGGTQLLSDALRVCGARNVFAELRDPGPTVSTEAVVARDPQAIIAVAPREQSERWLAEWKRFPRMRAVSAGNLIPFVDQRLNRMGPGVIEATQELCAAIDGARHRSP
jgi:iron complex transport system substrate-binding protein